MEKKKPDLVKIFIRCAIVLLVGVLAFAVFRIVSTLQERERSRQVHEQIVEMAVTMLPPTPAAQEVPAQTSQPEAEAERYYIPLAVDFSALRSAVPDIRAWIYSPDTPIHYPVVQGKDNRYYLRRMATGEYNYAGAIFLDRRNPSDLTGKYNLLHGHNLKDTSMFGTLPNYSDQAYYEAHKQLYLLTPNGDYVIELFAGFTARSDDKIYTIPATKKECLAIAEDCIARSDFVSTVQPQEGDQLMILSTCTYDFDDARYAVVGVMRKN